MSKFIMTLNIFRPWFEICMHLSYLCHFSSELENACISMMEQTVNPLLDDSNTEGFLQVHVYGYLVDRLFSDIPEVQVVRYVHFPFFTFCSWN